MNKDQFLSKAKVRTGQLSIEGFEDCIVRGLDGRQWASIVDVASKIPEPELQARVVVSGLMNGDGPMFTEDDTQTLVAEVRPDLLKKISDEILFLSGFGKKKADSDEGDDSSTS